MELTSRELAVIAQQAELLRLMGERRCRVLRLDYIPPRAGMTIPRLPEDGMEPMEVYAPTPTVLEFKLEDAMFGNVTYAAITCGGKVVVSPFIWHSYPHLATLKITTQD